MTLRYDVHTHAFHPKIAGKVLERLSTHYGITPEGNGLIEDLLSRLRAAGLDRALVHTAATGPAQVVPANNWAMSLSREHPELVGFGTMHPAHPDVEAELDRIHSAGVRGLKFHPDFQGFRMDDPAFLNVLEAAGDRFVLMFHVGDDLPPEKNPSCPVKLAAIRRDFPGPAIIAAHFGGYKHWSWALEHLAGTDVYLDTSSSLHAIDDQTLHAIWKRHPRERFLFGSDYPLADPGFELDRLSRRLRLNDDALMALTTNAAALFDGVSGSEMPSAGLLSTAR